MCGIGGIIRFNHDSNLNRKDLNTISKSIASRGPDGKGIWIHSNGNIGFAHRRLSIVDLK